MATQKIRGGMLRKPRFYSFFALCQISGSFERTVFIRCLRCMLFIGGVSQEVVLVI